MVLIRLVRTRNCWFSLSNRMGWMLKLFIVGGGGSDGGVFFNDSNYTIKKNKYRVVLNIPSKLEISPLNN